MGRVAQQILPVLDGGLDLVTNPLALELLRGVPTRTPDCENVHGDDVQSRLGCAPWWDTGDVPLRWFSFFIPAKLGSRGGIGIGDNPITPTPPPTTVPTSGRRSTPTKTRQFQITAPANGTIKDSTEDITVTWTPRTGAATYTATVKLEGTTIWTGTVASTELSATIPANTLDGGLVYAVTVVAAVGGKTVGTKPLSVAVVTRLREPLFLTPIGFTTTLTPTLHWDAVANATSYFVEIEKESVFLGSMTVDTNSYTIPADVLENGKAYSFKVQARNALPGAESTIASSGFIVKLDDTLVSPTILTPIAGIQYTDGVLVSCDPVQGADRYEMKLYSATGELLLTHDLEDCQFYIPDGTCADGATYKVIVIAHYGDTERCSDYREFNFPPAVYAAVVSEIVLAPYTELNGSLTLYDASPGGGELLYKSRTKQGGSVFRIHYTNQGGETPVWRGEGRSQEIGGLDFFKEDESVATGLYAEGTGNGEALVTAL